MVFVHVVYRTWVGCKVLLPSNMTVKKNYDHVDAFAEEVYDVPLAYWKEFFIIMISRKGLNY
jgi:hypothetical protein